MKNILEPRTPTPPMRTRALLKGGSSSPRVNRLTNNAMEIPEKAKEAGLAMATVGVRPVDTARFDMHSSVAQSPILQGKGWPTSASGTHPDSPTSSLLPALEDAHAQAGGAMSNPFVTAAAPAPLEVRSCVCVCIAV